MIIAGIDEAGLGPKLGPLIVSSSTFWVDDSYDPESTSLWDVFSDTTTQKKSKTDNRLLITDSKITYNHIGLPGLQRAVLSFLQSRSQPTEVSSLHALISELGAEHQLDDIRKTRWFEAITPQDTSDFIPDNDPELLIPLSSSAKTLHLRSRILTARMLNKLFAQGLNKSEVLLLQTGSHIRHIIENYSDQSIRIVVDKQGGKTYYAPFLMDILGGEWIETIREGASSSLYKIRNNIYIEFTPKADRKDFSVALSSIVSKLLRELLMQEFNRYFSNQIPDLRPTAGYPEDAKRYIAELTEHLNTSNITLDEIWRER